MGHVLAVKGPVLSCLAAALVLGLSGCGAGQGGGGGPVAKAMATAQQMIGGRKGRPAMSGPKPMTEAEIAAFDKPLMTAQVGSRGMNAYLTVRDTRGAVTTWTTPGGTTFAFRNGLLIETRGLGADLMSAAVPDPAQLAKTGTEYRRSFYVTAPDDGVEQRVYACTTELVGPETLTIAGQAFETQHLRETCLRDSRKLTSDFWLENGTVRKSRQWIGPATGFGVFERVKD